MISLLRTQLRRVGVASVIAAVATFLGFSLTSEVACAAETAPMIVVPSSEATLHIAVPVPPSVQLGLGRSFRLIEQNNPGQSVLASHVRAPAPDGSLRPNTWQLIASLPPSREGKPELRRFRVEQGGPQAHLESFRFAEVDDKSLGLWEDQRPVLIYRHGIMSKAGVPADRNRSTYVHPLYGLDGEVLTDDFPKDHYHHRGLFWAWPHVGIGGKEYSLWDIKGIHQRFERWLSRQADPVAASLGVETGWFVGEKKVVQERAWLRVYRASADEQIIDVDLTWIPLDQPLTLAGAEGKSYGGLTLRFAPRTGTVVTTPLGQGEKDLPMTRLPWADLSGSFAGATQPSGAAIFIAPDHPDYPPMWLTRHYGVLCVGWPGVEAKTFPPGQPIRCQYRVWIHRGATSVAASQRAYDAYRSSTQVKWETPAKARGEVAQALKAEVKADRVTIHAGDQLFTEYLYPDASKYPYFFPVNGPRTGLSITSRATEPYPHHSSLFFGCDRVNGGNYWQEGLERGRIVSQEVRLLRASGDQIVFEQKCQWQRPNADPPLRDQRKITVSAPSPDMRFIDFDITLTAQSDVRIEKNNHSLFAARVVPELSVKGGGKLINAHGDQGEKGTFAKPSPWADYSGVRNGQSEGIAILSHPTNPWSPPPWFTRDYGFFSPTPMYWLEKGFWELPKGQTLRLRYRVIVHAGDWTASQCESQFQAWSKD